MDWSTIASTVVGGLIGIASTLTAEWVRSRRDRETSGRAARLQLYGDYLAALSRTRSDLRAVARSADVPAEQRASRALEAFLGGGAYELRYQVAIVAPEDVVEASTAAFRELRLLRERLQEGALRSDPVYAEARQRWERAFGELRARIRADLATFGR
ncbi:hypothetical protein [Streptomyces sp. RK75]|uniref:hypothetical protein n=1 Tax=Streptomyces sp. RK75 TaxID=2824895 RepID=UPI001B35B9C8|nr:hypothetical protein [Streptomyces sp. RK75]MBQ0867412.1 hypothetical protein [Streptomyces sp. RK75]